MPHITALPKDDPASGKFKSRVTLEPGELVYLHPQCADVEVLSGTAYITLEQRDLVLRTGEHAALKRGEYSTLVSAEGKAPLVMQVIYVWN